MTQIHRCKPQIHSDIHDFMTDAHGVYTYTYIIYTQIHDLNTCMYIAITTYTQTRQRYTPMTHTDTR